MSIFDSIEKLITEHGSAAILSQQLAFAKDQFSDLESKVDTLRTENADLKAQLQRESLDHKQAREELQRLKDEHAEDIRIHSSGVEFRRGKRTGDKWLPFCAKCHLPAVGEGIVACSDQKKCGWMVLIGKKRIAEMIAEL